MPPVSPVYALREDLALPSMVRGPVDNWALARLASNTQSFRDRSGYRFFGLHSGFEIKSRCKLITSSGAGRHYFDRVEFDSLRLAGLGGEFGGLALSGAPDGSG